MRQLTLTPEDLLAGANAIYDVVIPPDILQARNNSPREQDGQERDMLVKLRPLSIGTFQLIINAARQDAGLIPLLMIKEALMEPSLSLGQIKQLHMGLIEFLIDNIRQISGLAEKKNHRQPAGIVPGAGKFHPSARVWLAAPAGSGDDHGPGIHISADDK